MIKACKELNENLGKQFSCDVRGKFIQISTPFTFPDGGSVELFLEDDGSYLSDMGETMRWLYMHSFAPQRTAKQMTLINEICERNNASFSGGVIQVSAKDLSRGVFALSQCCLRVSDIAMSFSGKTVQTMIGDVAKFFTANKVSFEKNPTFTGKYARQVSLDFAIPHSASTQESLVKVLTTTSSAHANRLVNSTLRTWIELEHERERRQFVTVFDDTTGSEWPSGSIDLIRREAKTVMWSKREELLYTLSPAA